MGLVRKKTEILGINVDTTMVPKLEFFLSVVGLRTRDLLATFISKDPDWLSRSLENTILPNYNFLKSILLTNDDKDFAAIKWKCGTPWDFRYVDKCISPNVKVLRELKVPESSIGYLMLYHSHVLSVKENEFKEFVSRVLEMGFYPLKLSYILALYAVSEPNKVTWDQCYEASSYCYGLILIV